EMRLDAFAERFCAAGYACLVFDYRHFGASDGEPRQLLSINQQLQDWASAIAYARQLPDVDGTRVALWGTSFGGGHAIVAGARDGKVAAVIAQCPFTSGIASVLAMEPLVAAKVTARGIADVASSVLRRDPVMVSLAGEPGTTALMTAADVVPGYLPLVPDGIPFVNQVPARIGLAIPTHSPTRWLKKTTVPTMVCVCDHDSVAPARPTVRAAEGNPRVTVERYDEGHFSIYVGDAFERIVADQLAYLRRTVPN
ncbi:MAG: alpha/beta fold hydrolase, partial [Gordonia sp. (in: high G+C Gram-positive bacteria)]|uniref:alpha/beta hydrolase n=1 Tax=Gordonia sp. (in: high G+C Gram-positive bacteria) TaxID=84139 RepID=UPI003BB61081